MKQLEKEEKEAQEKADLYSGAFIGNQENKQDGNNAADSKNIEQKDAQGKD